MAGTNFDYSIRLLPRRCVTLDSGGNFFLRLGLLFALNLFSSIRESARAMLAVCGSFEVGDGATPRDIDADVPGG